MGTQTQKKCPKLSTQRTHSSVERWATGISETTSAKEDTREPKNLGRACSRSVLPSNTQQEQCGTLTKPQRPRWGGRQHSLWLSPTSGHVRRAGVSSREGTAAATAKSLQSCPTLCDPIDREGTGAEKCHGAGPHSCPISSHTS